MTDDSHTVATFSDGGGLDYQYAPDYRYEVGQVFEFGHELKLWIDRELRHPHVEYAAVEKRHRELDVAAREWSVDYKIAFYSAAGEEIVTQSFSQGDLASWEDRKTNDIAPGDPAIA